MRRVEDVQGWLELGVEYDCPAIEVSLKPAAAARHGSPTMWMPIHGSPHCDPEIGNPQAHVHYDERFLTPTMVSLVRNEGLGQSVENTIFVAPITWNDGGPLLEVGEYFLRGFRDTVNRHAFRCVRTVFHVREQRVAGVVIHPGSVADWKALEAEMIRKRVDPKCVRCPHKGTPLAGAEVRGGVITCPAHTLQWREGTGELVPRYPLEVRHAAEVGESEGGAPVQAVGPADSGRAA